MGFNVDLRHELIEVLEVIFQETKQYNPHLTQKLFLETIVSDWLELYKHTTSRKLQKDRVKLKNKLKEAMKLSGCNQTELAQKTGINRCYLGRVIRGEAEPSISMALLILDGLGYPAYRITDLFYLEPVDQE